MPKKIQVQKIKKKYCGNLKLKIPFIYLKAVKFSFCDFHIIKIKIQREKENMINYTL